MALNTTVLAGNSRISLPNYKFHENTRGCLAACFAYNKSKKNLNYLKAHKTCPTSSAYMLSSMYTYYLSPCNCLLQLEYDQ